MTPNSAPELKPSKYPAPDRIWLQETSNEDGLDMFWYSTRPDGSLEPDLMTRG